MSPALLIPPISCPASVKTLTAPVAASVIFPGMLATLSHISAALFVMLSVLRTILPSASCSGISPTLGGSSGMGRVKMRSFDPSPLTLMPTPKSPSIACSSFLCQPSMRRSTASFPDEEGCICSSLSLIWPWKPDTRESISISVGPEPSRSESPNRSLSGPRMSDSVSVSLGVSAIPSRLSIW